MPQVKPSVHRSPWEPLQSTTFRYLWLATLVSNIGSWMHDVGAGWLMTSLTSSPVMVAMVQTATSLPAVFILLPSGALSDILDRRKYLIFGNIVMAVAALILAILVITSSINAWSLLGLTFTLGIGMAMIMPTWQAIIPEVVPPAQLHGAISLNTMGVNISRVIGSLLAGLIITHIGNAAVFLCNGLTFIFIITVLVRWKRQPNTSKLPPESFIPAIKTGLRYARHSPALQATIFRGVGFFFFASIIWALLPLIARDLLNGGPDTYSYLFAAISIGAITSALLMPRLGAKATNDQLITYASLVFAMGMIVTAKVPILAVTLVSLGFCGAAWITVMTCSQVSAQLALPAWIKSRGIAVFLTFFTASMALGPYTWGNVAALSSLPTAMLIAAAGVILAAFFTQRWPISNNENLDHSPSGHWKTSTPISEISPDQGPVMVSIRYELQQPCIPKFLQLMQSLSKARQRDGAYDWNLLQDMSTHHTYVEFYKLHSWLDHLRQHERISNQDAQIQHDIHALLGQGTKPVITHFVNPPHNENVQD